MSRLKLIWVCPWKIPCVMEADGYCSRCDRQEPLTNGEIVDEFCPVSRIGSMPTGPRYYNLVDNPPLAKEAVDLVNAVRLEAGG